jgi:hypothetical protein
LKRRDRNNKGEPDHAASPPLQELNEPELMKTRFSGLERSDRNKGEPDHAASPRQQEPDQLGLARLSEQVGAKRQKEKTWP